MYIFIRLVRRHATMQRRFIFLGFIYTKRNGRKSSMYDPKKGTESRQQNGDLLEFFSFGVGGRSYVLHR